MENKKEIPTWERVIKRITISLLEILICVFVIKKMWAGNIEIKNFDYLYFLSTIIAIFAIVLSILFYFKSTEQANEFYNAFTEFTNDVSVQLTKIDSVFGEKLTNIENSYKSIANSRNQEKSKEDFESIKQEMELSKQNIGTLKTQVLMEDGTTKQRINKDQLEIIKKNIDELEKTLKLTQEKIEKLSEKENEDEDVILIRKNVLGFLIQTLQERLDRRGIENKELDERRLRIMINDLLRHSLMLSDDFYKDAQISNVISENRVITKEAFSEIKNHLLNQD